MIKKLLVALLVLIPTLCFGNLGDTRQFIQEQLGSPAVEYSFSQRTKMCKYLFPDEETVVVVVFLNDKSVVETFFSKYDREVTQEGLSGVLKRYSEKWYPFPIDGNCRCVISENDEFRVCYGEIPGSAVTHGITVLTVASRPALDDMDNKFKFNGSRL